MKTWIIVADASGARIFDADGDELRLVREYENPTGRARNQELVTDRPGRVEKGKGRDIRSSLDPGTTPHDTEAVRFAGKLVHLLDQAYGQRAFHWLVIVAPPHFLGLLNERLPQRLAEAVIATQAKDYVKLPERELHALLADSLAKSAAQQRLAGHEHA
jgi:protein required for attachment to host cells